MIGVGLIVRIHHGIVRHAMGGIGIGEDGARGEIGVMGGEGSGGEWSETSRRR